MPVDLGMTVEDEGGRLKQRRGRVGTPSVEARSTYCLTSTSCIMELPEDPQSLIAVALEWYMNDRQVCAAEQRKHGNDEDAAKQDREARRAGAVLQAIRQGRIGVCETETRRTGTLQYQARNYGENGYEEETAGVCIDPSERTTTVRFDLGNRHVDLGLEVNEGDVLVVVSRTDETSEDGTPRFGDSDGTIRVEADRTVVESMLNRARRVEIP